MSALTEAEEKLTKTLETGMACAVTEWEIRQAAALVRKLAARCESLEGALRFQDPRNATERYDRIADDFYRETGLWPPGRSRPAAMGTDPDEERANREWRAFVNRWHETWFDAAHSDTATETKASGTRPETSHVGPSGTQTASKENERLAHETGLSATGAPGKDGES